MIGLQGQEIVAPLGLNLTGNRDLSPDGIERDNTAPNVQQFKQRRNGGDLVSLALDLDLAEQETMLAGPSTDDVQGFAATGTVIGPFQGFAINGDNLCPSGLYNLVDPTQETSL